MTILFGWQLPSKEIQYKFDRFYPRHSFVQIAAHNFTMQKKKNVARKPTGTGAS